MAANMAKYIVLGLLSHEKMSGYDIKKRAENSIGRFWNLSFGQIYPALAALEGDGLVEKAVQEPGKGPERHVYSITQEGRASLEEWLIRPGEKEYTRYGILLKLFFGAQLPKEVNTKRIREFKTRQEENLITMASFKEELAAVMGEEPDHLYYYLTVLFGERVYRAYIEWAEEALSLLRREGKY